MVWREELITCARSFLKVPFHHQGRSTAGLDCAGLVVLVLKTCGIPVKDQFGYGRLPYRGLLEQTLQSQFQSVTQPQGGDILLMRFRKEPQHLSFLTFENTLIHCYEKIGAVVEHRYAPVWQARTVKAFSVFHPKIM